MTMSTRLTTLLLALLFGGCSRSAVRAGASETRGVGGFSEIAVAGAFHVAITVGPLASLRITAPADVLPHVVTTVEGGRLRIALDGSVRDVGGPLEATVTLPALTGLELSGASHATVENVGGPRLRVIASGASHVTLHGRVGQLDVELSGASSLDGASAHKLQLGASGASRVEATVDGDLAVDLAGASRARITGHPRIVTREIGGVSTLELP